MLLLGYLLITVALRTCVGHGENIQKQKVEAADFFGSTKSDVIVPQEVPPLFSSPASLKNVSGSSRPPRVPKPCISAPKLVIHVCRGYISHVGVIINHVYSTKQSSNNVRCKGCDAITYAAPAPGSPLQLNLSGWNIGMMEKDWYNVNTDHKTSLDLSYNKLSQLTPELLNDLSREVVVVNLTGNDITQLKQGEIANQFPLEHLDLTLNGLSEIDKDALLNLKLVVLHLRNNSLKNTEFCTSLSSEVQYLDLSYNLITEISAGSFSRLKNLDRLLLNGNYIVEAKASQLRGLWSLMWLNLAFNELSSIEVGFFQDLINLTDLNLEGNHISILPKNVFTGLEKIQLIDLSFNKLTTITDGMFSKLPNSLTQLALNNNEIRNIEAGSLKLPSLIFLDMQNNYLAELNENTFKGLGGVQFINVSRNYISTLNTGISKYLYQLINIDISFNPIKTAKPRWLHECMHRTTEPTCGFNMDSITYDLLAAASSD